MSTPLITWICIVGLFAVILIVRFANAFIFCSKGKHRLFEYGTEREEFYLPGDPNPVKCDEHDYDDFDDL